MAKFRFSMEVLLKHREDIEQRERDALLRLIYAHQLAIQERNTLERKIQETLNELAKKQSGNFSTEEFDWFNRYLDRLRYEIEECEIRIAELDEEVQGQKQKVIEAKKQRKLLSTLKSKREKEFILAQNRKEQKEIEEWVSTKYANASRIGHPIIFSRSSQKAHTI